MINRLLIVAIVALVALAAPVSAAFAAPLPAPADAPPTIPMVDPDQPLPYASTYYEPDLGYMIAQTDTINIDLDTSQLFTGAQTMIDALSSPYLLIAGFGLGVAILAAIMKAVTSLRL
jgi:hypothetical protein